jgi:hypothetical protein
VLPIEPGDAKVAPLSDDAFRLATFVVEATTNGAVPVAIVEVITPVAETVVNAPVEAVVAPIDVLLIVLAAVGLIVKAPTGLIVTVPVPVGLIATFALAGDSVTAPATVSAGVIVTRPVLTLPMPIVPDPLALIVRLVFDPLSVTARAVVPPVAAPVMLRPVATLAVLSTTVSTGLVVPFAPTASAVPDAEVIVCAALVKVVNAPVDAVEAPIAMLFNPVEVTVPTPLPATVKPIPVL